MASRPVASRPVGVITRGTTNPNRLRRVDRYLTGPLAPVLRSAADPLVVDLGYGASPVTTLELADRLSLVRPDVQVLGLEVDPSRVALGELLARPGVSFALGGFELAGHRPCLVRAANVLRQYDVGLVEESWARVCAQLTPGGVLLDITCDELGRLASWVTVSNQGQPLSLTMSIRLAGLRAPSDVAPRLPKVLIHRNVPGEWVHDWLTALDDAWARSAPLANFGNRQRFLATVAEVRDAGWPVLHGRSRWRLGELTLAWPDLGLA